MRMIMIMTNVMKNLGVEGAGLVPWVGGPPDASLGLYLREAFLSQTNTEKIIYIIHQESLGNEVRRFGLVLLVILNLVDLNLHPRP